LGQQGGWAGRADTLVRPYPALGVLQIVAELLRGEVPQMPCFWPEPWPLDSDRPQLKETILAPEEEPWASAA
jgi:hypothetical protein